MGNVQRQSVGIDVSMDKIDCCFSYMVQNLEVEVKGSKVFENNAKGFMALLDWIQTWLIKKMELSFVMEATGVYYENLAYFFSKQAGFKVVVLLPNKSKAYKQSLNIKSKTDKIDAKTLSMMGLERRLEEWKAPSPTIQTMKELCREREALLDNKTMILNQLHANEHSAHANKDIIKRLKKHIKFIEEQILQIEKDIKNIGSQDEQLSLKINQLCSIPGVGWLTAITIISETNNFALFRNKRQLVSYAGLDVIENQSGKSAGKTRISRKGNHRLRKALYFPAMSHINCKSTYYNLFENIVSRTKIKMKAYVAVQRKLLTLMYALHKNQTFFDPNYAQKVAEQKKISAIGTL